mmetsp:Transcript_22525/g.66714  ORF Transcript_22525/g.66714 Transcript_22525/m.66714 type:complete len:384 (-) Transcript_22525:236-1387(-)
MYNNRGPTARAPSNNSRRAFRDVTNSTRNVDEATKGKPVVSKRGAAAAPVPAASENSAAVSNLRSHVAQSDVENPAGHRAVLPRQVSNTSAFGNGHHATRSNSVVSNATSYQHSGQVDNIDERDSDDPLCATDYVQDMYEHFRSKELGTSVRPIYMENQSHINERMRSILVDWLVEVHLKFKLVPETLYLTVNLIDRYLEKREVTRPKLQLVGVTCLLIASKYEEIYPPELRDLVYICDRAYSKNEILEMEEVVLKSLEYQITIPSAHAFLVRYLKAAHADKKIVQLACYILDGTLQSYNLLHYLPSQLAAAAVFIARRCVGRNSWSPTLLKYAVYCEEEVVPVARAVLAEKSSASPELRAVNKKYTSSRYGQVANTTLVCDF